MDSHVNFIVLLIGIVFFIVIYVFLKRSVKRNTIEDRLTSMKKKVKDHPTAIDLKADKKSFLDAFEGLKKTLEIFFKSSQNEIAHKYRNQFERAGFVTTNPALLFIVMKTGFITLAMFLYNFLLLFFPVVQAQTQLIKLLIFIIFILVGNRALNIYLSMRINRRYGEIKKDIPVALDLLILTTNAGLGLDRAFELVAEEISYTNVELGRELVMTSTELSIIPDRRQALKNLAERVDLDLVKEMTTTLIQSEEQGTPISQTLKILSEEFLKKRVLKVEEKASRLPVLLTIPLIVLILPSLFIVLMSPAIIQVFEKI